MSSRSQAMRSASSGLKSTGSAQRCSYNGLGCLKTPLYRRHRAISPLLPSRGTSSIQCCSDGLPRRPFRSYQVRACLTHTWERTGRERQLKLCLSRQVQRSENNFQEHDGPRQAPQENMLHTFWLQTLKARHTLTDYSSLPIVLLPATPAIFSTCSIRPCSQSYAPDLCSLDCLLGCSLQWLSWSCLQHKPHG